jgi:hypothetical protein
MRIVVDWEWLHDSTTHLEILQKKEFVPSSKSKDSDKSVKHWVKTTNDVGYEILIINKFLDSN